MVTIKSHLHFYFFLGFQIHSNCFEKNDDPTGGSLDTRLSYFSFKPMKRRKFYFSNTQAFAFMRISVCKSFAFTCFKRVKYNCSNQKFLICCCFRRCLLLFVVFVVVFFFCLFIYLSIQYGFRTSFNILGEFTIVSVCFFALFCPVFSCLSYFASFYFIFFVCSIYLFFSFLAPALALEFVFAFM